VLWRVTVVLVSVGVRVTADSLCVVVVVAGSLTTVVQDERKRPQAGMRRVRDNFFIVVWIQSRFA
jgi:hypothetical protein